MTLTRYGKHFILTLHHKHNNDTIVFDTISFYRSIFNNSTELLMKTDFWDRNKKIVNNSWQEMEIVE